MAILYEIHSDNNYTYAATSTGIEIIDIVSELPVCSGIRTGGFNSIAGNDETIYMGTNNSGIFCFDKVDVSTGDISSYIYSLNSLYLPSSNNIRSLSINGNDLAVVTDIGMDIIGMARGKEFKGSTTASGIFKSFLTSKKEVYYLENTPGYALCKHSPYSCNWDRPGEKYVPKKSFLEWEVTLNDLFITENTTKNKKQNTIFLTTSSGIYVYDEESKILDIYFMED